MNPRRSARSASLNFPSGLSETAQLCGHPGQLIGPQLPGMLGQEASALSLRAAGDRQRQIGQEPLNNPHVLDVELTGPPGRGGGRLSGGSGSPVSVVRAASGSASSRGASLRRGDPQPVGQHLVRRSPDLADVATPELQTDIPAQHRLTPDQLLATSGQPHQIAGRQRGQVKIEKLSNAASICLDSPENAIESMFES